MLIAEQILYLLIGFAGIIFAYYSHRIHFSLPDRLPSKIGKRKIIFTIGFGIILLGFVSDYVIGAHHQAITLLGGWLMLLGSTPWFNRRIVRRLFDPVEMRIIRITLFTSLFLVILSTGLFFLPPHFSAGTLLIGIANMILAGRLWWNQDVTGDTGHMVFSKRDYS